MFNIFKKKDSQPNVVKEPEPKTYYRLGLTDNNRVTFWMSYTEVSMNAEGVDQMIKQLEFYRDQLQPEQEEE